MDAWLSPNHCAFVAVTVHLKQDGIPLCLLLDIVEVAEVCAHASGLCFQLTLDQLHNGFNLAAVFTWILDDFKIEKKVSTEPWG